MKIPVLLLIVLAAGCSTDSNRREPGAAAGSPRIVAPVATNAAEPAPASAAPAVNPDLLKLGYRPVRSKGTLFYCRSEAITGSQFHTKVCLTESQIKDRQEQTRRARDQFDAVHPLATCTGPYCPGGFE